MFQNYESLFFKQIFKCDVFNAKFYPSLHCFAPVKRVVIQHLHCFHMCVFSNVHTDVRHLFHNFLQSECFKFYTLHCVRPIKSIPLKHKNFFYKMCMFIVDQMFACSESIKNLQNLRTIIMAVKSTVLA